MLKCPVHSSCEGSRQATHADSGTSKKVEKLDQRLAMDGGRLGAAKRELLQQQLHDDDDDSDDDDDDVLY